MEDEWRPDGWWRVLGPDDRLWCETSNEQEARSSVRPGDVLERHERCVAERWVRMEPT